MKFLGLSFLVFFVTLSASALNPNSVYHYKGQWTNQDKKAVEFSSLKGRVRIVSMVFTRCPSACPTLIGDIKHFLSKLPPADAAKVGVDVFSFDHEKDTPEALKEFTKKYKLPSPQWNIYHGEKAIVSELAGLLGVQYKRLEGGAYVHSNNIILLSKEGEILKTVESFGPSSEEFLTLLKKALSEP